MSAPVSVRPPASAAPAPRRYRPRTRFAQTSIALVNRLARPRDGLSVAVEGMPLRLTPAGIRLCAAAPPPDTVTIVFGIGADGQLGLQVPARILSRLVKAVQPGLEPLPSGPAGALLVELALATHLDSAERVAGTGLRVDRVAPPSGGSRTIALLLDGKLDGDAFQARLDLDPAEVGRPAQAAALALVEALEGRAADLHLRLPISCRAGHTRLTLHQLARLRLGDAILPDIWHLAQDEIRMTVGTSHAATAKTDRHTATLKTPLRPIVTGSMGGVDAAMAQEMTPDAGPAAEAAGTGLDAVGVTLAFELGRLTVSLAELRGIGAGHVFDLGLAPEEPVDLVVNGSRIGRGEIVEIGERIGVRVVRLYGPEAGQAGPNLGHD